MADTLASISAPICPFGCQTRHRFRAGSFSFPRRPEGRFGRLLSGSHRVGMDHRLLPRPRRLGHKARPPSTNGTRRYASRCGQASRLQRVQSHAWNSAKVIFHPVCSNCSLVMVVPSCFSYDGPRLRGELVHVAGAVDLAAILGANLPHGLVPLMPPAAVLRVTPIPQLLAARPPAPRRLQC